MGPVQPGQTSSCRASVGVIDLPREPTGAKKKAFGEMTKINAISKEKRYGGPKKGISHFGGFPKKGIDIKKKRHRHKEKKASCSGENAMGMCHFTLLWSGAGQGLEARLLQKLPSFRG